MKLKETIITILLQQSYANCALKSKGKVPNIYGKVANPVDHCGNNAILSNWCNEKINSSLECMVMENFNEYGHRCYDRLTSVILK